jgi:hypothetical protein
VGNVINKGKDLKIALATLRLRRLMGVAGGKRGTHFPRQADMFIILLTLLSNLKTEEFTGRWIPSTFGAGHGKP